MNKLSRRALSRYVAQQIVAGEKPAKVAKQLASVMLTDGGAANAHLLVNDIIYELEIGGHLSIAKLTTAREVSGALQNEFIKAVKDSVGTTQVELETTQDPSLIGGYKLETATRAWDMTIKKKLLQLKEAF